MRRIKNKRKKLEEELETFALKEFYKFIKKIKRNERKIRYIG